MLLPIQLRQRASLRLLLRVLQPLVRRGGVLPLQRVLLGLVVPPDELLRVRLLLAPWLEPILLQPNAWPYPLQLGLSPLPAHGYVRFLQQQPVLLSPP